MAGGMPARRVPPRGRDGEQEGRIVGERSKTPSRVAAVAVFVIGLGLAYGAWPADLNSAGAGVYAFATGIIVIAAVGLAVLLWK